MMKLLSILIAPVVMAGGLMAFASSPATAACPYTGCIPTNTVIKGAGDVVQRRPAKFCVRVGTDGNAEPRGKVTVTVERGKGGFEWSDSKRYNDSKECFTTPPLEKRGNYIIKAHFDARPDSNWENSRDRAEFQVSAAN